MERVDDGARRRVAIARSLASRALLSATLVAAASAATAVMAACGGPERPSAPNSAARARPAVSTDGGASLLVSPPPSGLPPMAPMPPAGVAGSKKARIDVKAFPPCGEAFAGNARAKDPAAFIKKVGEACASSSTAAVAGDGSAPASAAPMASTSMAPMSMRPIGAPFRGDQADRDAHQDHRFHVEALKCYRIVFATSESAQDAVVVVRDSAGDVVTESTGPLVPREGAMCFDIPDDVTVLVGIGAGKGTYVAQPWSN